MTKFLGFRLGLTPLHAKLSAAGGSSGTPGSQGYQIILFTDRLYLEQERTLADGSKAPGLNLRVAIGREDYQRRYDFRTESVLNKPPKEPTDPRLRAMKEKLKTPEGRRVYAKRKQTSEPVFGIIKGAMGFRQFLLRGLDKVRGEWNLVTMAYNLKRLFALAGAT